jgi:RimJ/RimL family protein N-acetyltransferase
MTGVSTSLDPSPAPRPTRVILSGRLVTVAPLDAAAHAPSLYEHTRGDENAALWTYLANGPYPDLPVFQADLSCKQATEDPLFFAIVDNTDQAAKGYACYLRIEPAHRSIEVGHIVYAPALQRTPGATEAMYLMARHVFETLSYRRYEWKCDALNQRSRRAALRLGFQFEGIFRQHMIVKGRSRDTAWFSMLDSEWPERKRNFEQWLSPANFDKSGRQRVSLSTLNGRNTHTQALE